ncbi:MAG: 2-phospho-L-lactate guanylyltransferase [Gammaproteobacteria bacterium]|nr:2-phospho-L-lactate guanylyltransferase [Gammaproteobacteria bacterium]
MWAIVPVKTFDRAKQRLADVLSGEERRSLMLAMARDVLSCLAKCSELNGILIVSRAPEADALAQAFGTERFAESPNANLPESLEQATQHLIANFHACGVIVVPADVPGIQADELNQLLRDHTDITIMPDTDHIGTNGLICTPPGAIAYVFDGKSFKPHVDAAFAAGFTPRIVPNTRFTLDVDLPQDLLEVYRSEPTSQTSNYLRNAGIIDRLQALTNSQSG